MAPATFRCLYLTRHDRERPTGSVTERPSHELPEGLVTIRVAYSSLNYKDALSMQGHPGVTRKFPHVPGIDASGTVVESSDPRVVAGSEVIVTGFEQGMNRWGGYSELIRVPAEWLVSLPSGLTLRESMIFGTAGLTAGLCLSALEVRGVKSGQQEVLVTGASGGVGSLAVAILSHAGYRVVAATGKPQAHQLLTQLGAHSIIGRDELCDSTGKPLLAERWEAVIDTVGGNTLATIVRAARRNAVIAACGLVGGIELPLTVYPFILRGVDLVGVDSAECPVAQRNRVWKRLSSDWKPRMLESIVAIETGLDGVSAQAERILQGQVQGRVLVRP